MSKMVVMFEASNGTLHNTHKEAALEDLRTTTVTALNEILTRVTFHKTDFISELLNEDFGLRLYSVLHRYFGELYSSDKQYTVEDIIRLTLSKDYTSNSDHIVAQVMSELTR